MMRPLSPAPAARPESITLEVRGVGRHAGSVRLLAGVSFTVYPGEVVALVGPSGAGKSTLLGCLNGYTRPDEGAVLYAGLDLTDTGRPPPRIGFVPQDDIVHPQLTVESSLEYAMRLRVPEAAAPDVSAAVERVLDQVDLVERRRVRVSRLSGGQRKRVSIGVELVARPQLLFLDEPTSGLDPALEKKLMDLFRRLAREGRVVVLTTHVMDSLDAADLLAVLYSGRLVFFGPPREALAHFGVTDAPSIFGVLARRSPDDWREAFETSRFRQLSTERPRPGAPVLPPAPDAIQAEIAALRESIRGR